jgi:hypothetical protein
VKTTPFSRVATAVLLASAACVEGGLPSQARGPRPASVRLSISAEVSSAGRTMKVVAMYARAGAPATLIPIDSTILTLTGTETQLPVSLDIAACVADAGRELPAGVAATDTPPVCVLHISLALYDASNVLIDQVLLAPLAARPGEEASAPTASLGTVVGGVTLATDTVTLNALGRTVTLSATVRDAKGQPLGSAELWYATLSPTVAGVDSLTGLVTARAVGTALVVATSRDHADTAAVTVRQVPATIALSGVAGTLVIGDAGVVVAVVRDSGGATIPAAAAPVQLASSDAAVLAVDSPTGRVTAASAGTAILHATIGTASAAVTVTVIPPSLVLNVGLTTTATATRGTNLALPIVVDMQYARGQTLGSLQLDVTWDAAAFDYVGTASGTFGAAGSFFVNADNAAAGSISVSAFDADGFAAGAPTIFTVTLLPKGSATSTTVRTAVTVAGDANGGAIPTGNFIVRPLAVTIQ